MTISTKKAKNKMCVYCGGMFPKLDTEGLCNLCKDKNDEETGDDNYYYCESCNRQMTEDEYISLSSGEIACEECARYCDACDEYHWECDVHMCDTCEKTTCEIYTCDKCGSNLCEDCSISCNSCGNNLCEDCSISCDSCGETFCEDCLNELNNKKYCENCFNEIKEDKENEKEVKKCSNK